MNLNRSLLILTLAYFASCNKGVVPQEDWTVEPFWTENMEFRTNPDTALVFYVNRDMSSDTGYTINFDISSESDRSYHYFAAISEIAHGNRLILPISSSKAYDSLSMGIKDVNAMLYQHVLGEDTVKTISLRVGMDPIYVLMNRERYTIDGLLNFTNSRAMAFQDGELIFQKFDVMEIDTNSVADTMIMNLKTNEGFGYWRNNLYRNYEGRFDSIGRKQGDWTWYYSNGSKMMEAMFVDDSLIGNVKKYDYYGKRL